MVSRDTSLLQGWCFKSHLHSVRGVTCSSSALWVFPSGTLVYFHCIYAWVCLCPEMGWGPSRVYRALRSDFPEIGSRPTMTLNISSLDNEWIDVLHRHMIIGTLNRGEIFSNIGFQQVFFLTVSSKIIKLLL